jgi:hypothetical protein
LAKISLSNGNFMDTLMKDITFENIPQILGGGHAGYNEPYEFDISETGPLHYPGAPISISLKSIQLASSDSRLFGGLAIDETTNVSRTAMSMSDDEVITNSSGETAGMTSTTPMVVSRVPVVPPISEVASGGDNERSGCDSSPPKAVNIQQITAFYPYSAAIVETEHPAELVPGMEPDISVLDVCKRYPLVSLVWFALIVDFLYEHWDLLPVFLLPLTVTYLFYHHVDKT